MDDQAATIDPALLERNIQILSELSHHQLPNGISSSIEQNGGGEALDQVTCYVNGWPDDEPLPDRLQVPNGLRAFHEALTYGVFGDVAREPQVTWPRCPSDPLTRYARLLAQPAVETAMERKPTSFLSYREREVRQIYRTGYQYGLQMCELLHRLDHTKRYDMMLSLAIQRGPEWLWKTPGYPSNLARHLVNFDDVSRFRALLNRLELTIEMLSELRVHCILILGFDVTEYWLQPPLANRDTSDSCDSTNDEDDSMYSITRTELERFQLNSSKTWIQVSHYENRRLRRDIRAWARLARYGCMKLPGATMLVHKHKGQIPRRRRKEPSVTEHFQSEPTIWHHHRNSGGGSSGNSSASSDGSGNSISSGHKRKRMPTLEGGYPCIYPGCEKKFDRDCDRRHHLRNHQDNCSKPYACETCDKRFVFPKDLRRHERTVHADPATSEDIVSYEMIADPPIDPESLDRSRRVWRGGRGEKRISSLAFEHAR